ncbi:PTS sugar transporter subunit IIB [Sebaldella sp. S0638]|uniref:PTS sugar transporter subunit IIB n=1 Tax=Sebaldella sp. S0638 TaxID=2957809 RepID=UPI0020A194B4|nr:PTS sugar transporter subunit IIB [Sebaldella sp. S0638]MCP1223316.1 PTS sugar transporter subunit IIB [Sebaldella sp. S0638]
MKVLTVCGLGMGTSLILKMNVESILNENKVKANIEHMDVSAAKSTDADLIVTSYELAGNLEGHKAKLVVIKNFFDKEEITAALKEAAII